MKVKANKGFSGFFSNGKPFTMHAGEVREVDGCDTVQELIAAGYLEDMSEPVKAVTEDIPDEVKPDEDKRGKSKRG